MHWDDGATASRIARGRPRTPVTFFAPPKKVTKERGIPGSPRENREKQGLSLSSTYWDCPCFSVRFSLSLRCSTIPAVCATRARSRLLQIPRARFVGYPFNVCAARPVLARIPGPVCAARRLPGAPGRPVDVVNKPRSCSVVRYSCV